MQTEATMERKERKEREFKARRSQILEQAEKVFAAKGFHNTTVAEIAAASGFAVGTLYQFFRSKEQLYAVMLTEKLNMLYAGVREAVEAEGDVVRKIEHLVSSQFRFVEENADFCGIFVRRDHLALSSGSATLRKRMADDYEIHVSFTEGVLRDGIRAGVLKEMDPRMMAAALTGIINSCAAKWLTMAKETTLMSHIPFVVNVFLGGVRKNAL